MAGNTSTRRLRSLACAACARRVRREMTEELEAEFNNWSVQELKDVLGRNTLPTTGLKKALIARLVASGQYTLTGPDYDRWTVTALKAAAREAASPRV